MALDDFEVVLFYDGRSGTLEHDGHSYPIAAFGGTCPDVGDRILNPGASPRAGETKIDFNDPERRTFWKVKERIFMPDAKPPRCILVAENVQATMRESTLL
jgi:hypothetical protein